MQKHLMVWPCLCRKNELIISTHTTGNFFRHTEIHQRVIPVTFLKFCRKIMEGDAESPRSSFNNYYDSFRLSFHL